MALVSFRPHTLRIATPIDGYYDENRDFHQGGELMSAPISCRYEPNGAAKVVPIGEGRNSVYSYKVYLDVNCPDIPFGTRLELFDARGSSIGVYSSLGFHRGQLDSKLWV